MTRRNHALLIAAGGHAALLWPMLATPEHEPALASTPVMTVSLVTPAPQPPRPIVKVQPRTRTESPPAPRTPEAAPVVQIAPPPTAAPVASPQPAAIPPAPPAETSVLEAPVFEAPVFEARFDAAYLNNPKPAYPPLARRLGEQGQVLLRAYISADGRPEAIELRRSSGSARLDAAAQDTVRRWRFVPARRGDAAIAAWVLIPINFRLDS